MTDWIPTTEEVRRTFAYAKAGDGIHRANMYFDAFDRWLQERCGIVSAENERLRLAFDAAPHDRFCSSYHDVSKCDCWKSDVLVSMVYP